MLPPMHYQIESNRIHLDDVKQPCATSSLLVDMGSVVLMIFHNVEMDCSVRYRRRLEFYVVSLNLRLFLRVKLTNELHSEKRI